MQIFRVENTSTKTLAIHLLAVLALSTSAISQSAIAQSFDYPANSPTLFNRGSQQSELPHAQPSATAGYPETQLTPTPQVQHNAPAKNSLFSKLFSRKNQSSQPIFATPSQASSIANIPSYRAGKSVYVDPYAQPLNNRQENQANHASGYQPTNQSDHINQVNFNQFKDSKPHSILELSDANTGTQNSNSAITTTYNQAITPAPANVAPTTSTRLSSVQRAQRIKTVEQRTEKISAQPIAKVAQRVSIPRNAFQQEFDKAYRYINQSTPKNENSPARIAQAEDAPGELSFEDFPAQRSRPSVNGDFTPDNPLTIDTPPFVRPEQYEQSPNASQPDFIPPNFSDDSGKFNTDPRGNTTPNAAPSTIVPGEQSESSLREALKANDIDANDIQGDFYDSLGNVDDWEPPKPSSDQQTLEDELAELSKPLLRTNAATSAPILSHDQSPTWWKQQVNQPLHPENQSLAINSNGLVFAALQNSPRIQAVSKNPLIRELQVVEADAEFDPVRFVRSQFQDRVDPVGSSLTIGQGSTEPFLLDNIWTAEAGIRRKLRTGADFTVSQQLGFQNSNSNNFIPQDQGTATLALNVTQPLLRGRGRAYNQAQILIAQSTGGVAWEVFQKELQEELEAVVGAYWQLYLERSVYLQRKRNVERGQVILNRLNGRRELDSLPAQIARAKSSVLTRKTELANAFRNVRNAETEIRRRVADRNWMASQSLELLPEEIPTIQNVGWELDQVVKTALNHRPEIRESMRRIKIAGVQRDVSENELLPELSFLVGTYVSALQGESDILGAFGDQFGGVTPGYSFGLEYELPRLNRAARSRFQQRHLQFKRLQNELEEVIQNVIAESQIALRRITSAIETLAAAEEAIIAARADLDQNEIRWESFALIEGDIAEGVTPTTILDQLLDSQERLSQAEIVYAQAEQELKISELALQRSMGTLLMHQQVSYDRNVAGDTPMVNIQKRSNNGPTPISEEVVDFTEQPAMVE